MFEIEFILKEKYIITHNKVVIVFIIDYFKEGNIPIIKSEILYNQN